MLRLITNGPEDLPGGPDSINESRGLAQQSWGCIKVTAFPRLGIGWDYLLKSSPKLLLPAIPLLGEPVVVGSTGNSFRPWRCTGYCDVNNVKDLTVDRIIAITANDQFLVGSSENIARPLA